VVGIFIALSPEWCIRFLPGNPELAATWNGTVSFVQEIRSESPESHEKTSVSCHCERSEAIFWPIWGLLRRLRRLAM
jgi:hypothetical protein